MIKGIIFDVDGVVLDSMWIWRDMMSRFLSRYSTEPEHDLMDKIVTMTFDESSVYLRDYYSIPKEPNEILEEIFAITGEYYDNEIELKPGILNYLEGFRQNGIKMAAATASDRSYIESAFRRHGIIEYFDTILTCRELKTSKTEPLIYHEAAKELGLSKNEVAVFEDSLYAIETCHKDGLKVVGISDRSNVGKRDDMRKLTDLFLENYDSFDLFLHEINL